MAAGYVTNFGNPENDGLTREKSKRSIQSAKDAGLYPLFLEGYFNETIDFVAGSQSTIDGQNKTIWDGTLLTYPVAAPSSVLGLIKGLVLKNFTQINSGYYQDFEDVICKDIPIINTTADQDRFNGWTNCLVYNISTKFNPDVLKSNTTVFNSKIQLSKQEMITNLSNHIIISECSVEMIKKVLFKYCLFHNSSFKFSGGGLGNDETVYSYPTGANDTEKFENLRSRMATVYGGVASQYLIGCKYQTDGDLFINPTKENFFLVPDCQASKMSYDASYVGKYPEGSIADFSADFASYTNLDASGNIIDQTVDASAETNIIDLGKLRHINNLVALGQRAARNGNQVNVDADLGATIHPGTDLTDGKTYLVHTEAISQAASGKTRDVGETFIATVADGLAFTSATGYVQEVYLDKPRSIEIKASKTDPTLATSNWIKMDLYSEPRVNYNESGVIQYGNLDAGYNEVTSDRMFIRYWKVRVTIKAKNLPA